MLNSHWFSWEWSCGRNTFSHKWFRTNTSFETEAESNRSCYQSDLNRPFAQSGHVVRNKLCWDAKKAVGLPKQRNSNQSSLTFFVLRVLLGFSDLAEVSRKWNFRELSAKSENPTALFASQHNLFRTMWTDRAKGLLAYFTSTCTAKTSWSCIRISLAGVPHFSHFYDNPDL